MYNPLELRDDLKKNEDRDPFGRVPPKPKPEPELTNLGDASKLSRPVGEQGKNDRRDVAKVETMLGRSGALDLKKTDGPTGYWGERTREATRAFQKQNRLKVDGQINPGGETIRTLAKVAGGLIKTLAGNTAEKADAAQPAPRHSDTPSRHPGAGRGPERSDSLVSGLAGPTIDKPPAEHPPYALSDDVVSENRRMARALAKRRGIGDFDRFTTDAINTDGAKAVYEIGDLIKQVRDNDPQQADELLEKTRQGIAPANVRLLAQIAAAEGADQVTEPARRDAPAQQTPESQDARSPSAPKDKTDDLKSPDDLMLEPGAKYRDPDEWTGKLGETAGDIGGAAADVAKSAWINATGSPQEVKDNLSNLSKEYRAKGYTKAADNLDHFLNGKGAAKTIPRDEARKDPFIRDAETENRKRFETQTFLGISGKEVNNRKLRSLKDGETTYLDDYWDVERKAGGAIDDLASLDRSKRDDALAEGRKDFTSKARFTATRRGDKIYIQGNVDHDGSERYDFESGGIGDMMGAKSLSDADIAHEFTTIREWGQTFEGTVDVSPAKNGNALTNPRFKWQDTWKDKNPKNRSY
ncbi:peptidoglycan-binding domain-containing protein [Thalassospiraceae bacterium LMO-JJ14]|nr:peptidoglycan-binding domain-containing protein [Thalassospiraceae bacterium LMO-JJ14]